MPLSNNPQDEIKKQTQLETATTDLRQRWDNDYSLFRLDPEVYEIPASEGEWDKVITNKVAAEGYKIMDYLAYARRKLWIPITSEKEKSRGDLRLTEQLANGCIYLADDMESDVPEYVDSQSMLAFYRVIRGWSAIRFMLREEKGKLISDSAIWDIRNTYWISGRKRLLYASYVRWVSETQTKDEYKGWNGKVDDYNGMVKITNPWDCSEPDKQAEEGVIIGTEYVKGPAKIGLDYLPIRIKAGRGAALIHDEKHTDNIKMVGESFLASNRTLAPIESRALSYMLTRAGQEAKAPRVIEYDGNLGKSPELEMDPSVKGRTVFLDTSKGQKLAGELTPKPATNILQTLVQIEARQSIGGLSPVAYGQINQALPAQGIDILSHSTMDVIKPFKKGMQDDYIWWAQEATRQYKNGNFSKHELEGVDQSNNHFRVEIKPKDIDDKWRFECELVPDLLRDRVAMAGLASQLVRDKITSRRTARDITQIVDDPDLEQSLIEQEDTQNLFEIPAVKALLSIINDYAETKDEGKRFILQHAWDRLMQLGQLGQEQPTGQPSDQAPGGGAPPGPLAMTRGNGMAGRAPAPNQTSMAKIPNAIRQAARAFRLGLGR